MTDKSSISSKNKSLSIYNNNPEVNTINHWASVDGIERLIDGTIKKIRFSIQDIPKDRYDEAISLMENSFLRDEPTCKSLNILEDKDAINDFRTIWNYIIKQGISVGAFKTDSNNITCELVGVNILYLSTIEREKDLENIHTNFKSVNSKKILDYLNQISNEINIYKMYNVDKYLVAMGLTVKRALRGQKLGFHLVRARDLIGKKYGITITSTHFTSVPSQIIGESLGYKTIFRHDYSKVLDENGKPLFPNIESKENKLMVKQLK